VEGAISLLVTEELQTTTTTGGSSRRLVIFPLSDTRLKPCNTDLKPTIIRDELVHVMKRCIKHMRQAYNELRRLEQDRYKPACKERKRKPKEQTISRTLFEMVLITHQILFVDGANTAVISGRHLNCT
jgi:hypothetical protein